MKWVNRFFLVEFNDQKIPGNYPTFRWVKFELQVIWMRFSWLIIDEENDYISVSSNEELVQALDANLSKTESLKFYVQSKLLF